MSTRRITLLCFAAVMGVWVLLFVVPSLRYRSNVTREHFDQIEPGMTMAEVGNLLGGPPGFYTDRYLLQTGGRMRFVSVWLGDEGIITISWTFQPSDGVRRVVFKKFEPSRPLTFDQRCERVFPWW